ncbi:MAG: PKD domain-containing protein, partial [Rhodothermales bacterium]|nr:PKD domain-containing protein [Rhodothermales bacterium]
MHPNPVPSGVVALRVRYTTPGNVRVDPKIEVFDVLGRRIPLPADLAAGVYFYRLRFDNRRVSEIRDFVLAAGSRITIVPEQAFDARGGSDAKGQASLSKTTGMAGVRISVEKAGYVTDETVRQIDNEVQVQVDFSLEVAAAPSASFSVAGTLEEGKVVTFDASASSGAEGEELSYLWDLGTGAKATGQQIGFVFGASGTYPVKLTVTGAFGATATATSDVTVEAGAPATGSTTVSALVFNEAGIPLEAATVQVVGETGSSSTDRTGLGIVEAPSGVPVTLRVGKSGYATQSVQLHAESDGSPALVRVTLHPRAQPSVLENAQRGGTVEGEDGAAVTLPFDALVDSQGDPVDGNVEVSLTSLDILSDEIESFPGQFQGVTADGADTLIVSYGVTEFSLTQNGTELQLADGKTAEIEIPVYSSTPTVGDEIPLWSVDEATGKWIQEGTGVVVESSSSPTGLAMRATVGHFSWYNIDRLGCGRDTRPATAIAVCQDADSGDAIPCWARVRVSEEGASPGGSVPPRGLAFLLCEGWSTKFKAWATIPPSVPGGADLYLAGEADVPPLGVADTAEVFIPMAPFDIGEAIPIAYGDTIYGRVGVAEIDRYAIQGQTGDYVRLGISASPSGDLDGLFRFRDPDGTVLEEYGFFDRPSYRFETLR